MSLMENLERVRERIARAAAAAGRSPSEITIVAVTKTFGPDAVEEAIRAGIADVGENRVQEFLEKSKAVTLPCRWHLVGHLQTNKVPKAIGRFALIQSVDSLRLAEHLNSAGAKAGAVTNILLEVNTSGEESKYGLRPEETVETCGLIARLPSVRVRGLMTVGPLATDVPAISAAFAKLRGFRDEIARAPLQNVTMEHLSMGMTDDFEIAIAEGSTMIRLGRVLFGDRTSAAS